MCRVRKIQVSIVAIGCLGSLPAAAAHRVEHVKDTNDPYTNNRSVGTAKIWSFGEASEKEELLLKKLLVHRMWYQLHSSGGRLKTPPPNSTSSSAVQVHLERLGGGDRVGCHARWMFF